MTPGRRALRLAAPLLAAILAAGACRAEDSWFCVLSPHFKVLTQNSVESGYRYATAMEQFYLGMNALFPAKGPQPPRITVVLFPDDESFAPYKPLQNGRPLPKEVAGFFISGNGINAIALNLNDESDETRREIQHETVHWFFSMRTHTLPVWLNEGVAEVYSTFRMVDDDTCSFGEPVQDHINFLAHAELMPLGELFKITSASVDYDESRRTSILYAESWALVHYMIFSDDARKGGNPHGLNRYLNALSAGPVSEKTFTGIFGLNYAQTRKRLDDYVADGAYHVFQFRLPHVDVEKTLLAYRGRPGDVDLALGTLLLGTRGADKAESCLRRASQELPQDPATWETLGGMALMQGNGKEAVGFFSKAEATGSTSCFTYFHLACLRDGDNPAKAAALLRKAIMLKPNYASAYHHLATVIPDLAEPDPSDALMMRYASATLPNDASVKVALAALAFKNGQKAEARQLLEAVLAAPDSPSSRDARTGAEHLLQKMSQ